MIMIMTDDLCCGSFSDVLINSSSECFVDQDGGGGGRGGGAMSFSCLAVLGKNECLCASILELRKEHRLELV